MEGQDVGVDCEAVRGFAMARSCGKLRDLGVEGRGEADDL